jgi:transient receptor potential cation channel subfamily M protein 2
MLHEIACAKHVDEIEKMTVQLMADKYTELLTIHRFDNDDSGHSIYKAITGTLIKAAKSEKTGTDKTKIERELELALTWNRADIARDEILTRERRNEWKEGTVRREALHAALVDDKHAFVTVILDTGFQLSYLAESEIEVLYDEAMNGPTSGIIGKLLNDKLRQKSNCSRGCTGGNQDSNRNDNQKRKSTKNGQQDELPVKLSEIHRFINKLIHHTEGQLYVQGESRSNKASTVDCPERELFLWALLLNRRQLAMIFWRAGKDHIGGALTASMLMKSLSDMVYKEGELELAGELRTNSMYFEMLATGLLNECYQLNKPVAQKLLVRRLHNWNEKTLFQLADSSMQMIFMEHSCCQTLLNEIWRGKVARAAAFWQVFTGMFCPLIPIFVMKTSDNSKTAPEKKKE